MRRWKVGGALIPHGDGLVLVCNRRKDGSIEWTPPGGVIDPGETVLGGLAREVLEETGLVVASWSHCSYTVTVDAPDMGWSMRVEAWLAAEVNGDVVLADPDGIVEEVRFAAGHEAPGLLAASPPWVRVPLVDWLDGNLADDYRFALHGTQRRADRVERLA